MAKRDKRESAGTAMAGMATAGTSTGGTVVPGTAVIVAADHDQIDTPTRRGADGRRVTQMRKRRSDEWTDADQVKFIAHLAATANVTASARAVGKSQSGVYLRRSKSASFREAWAEALTQGYARLEAMLLDRAFNGRRTEIVDEAGEVVVRIDYSDALALNLLRQHQRVVAEQRTATGPAREDPKVVRARIAGIIDALVARMPDRPPVTLLPAPECDGTGGGAGEGESDATSDGVR